jgi:hypothetical protein
MKIEFSKNELKMLLELLYFGEYMFSSSENDYPDKKKEYENTLQKIFKEAKKIGLQEYVAPIDKDELGFSFELDKNEIINDVIDNYNNDNFWLELMSRLGARDVIEKIGEEKYLQMDNEESFKIRTDAEAVYDREFEKSGLKNLKILNTDLPY